MKSVTAVLLGMIVALVIASIVLVGILAPVFSVFMGLEGAGMTPFVGLAIAIAVGLAFYFGGMLASYRAPSRRRLHGVLVAVISFALSVSVNLSASAFFETEDDPLANLRTGGQAFLTVVLFVVSVAAAYMGSRRGEGLYAHNLEVARRMEARERAKARRAAEQREAQEASGSSEASERLDS